MPSQLRDQQLRALQAELSGSCTVLQDPERASYAVLGTRIEQLLRLAEDQASGLIDAARAEAAEITSSAGSAALSTMRSTVTARGALRRAPRTARQNDRICTP